MATASRTWAFASDAESLADAGNSSVLTFAHQSGDGNPSGCVEVDGTAKGATETEYGRNPSTGATWASLFGINAGDTVTAVQVTGFYRKTRVGGGKLSSATLRARFINPSQIPVHSTPIINAEAHSVTADSWTAGSAQSSQAVLGSYQAGSQDVRLEVYWTVVWDSGGGGPTQATLAVDQITVQITYTPAATVYNESGTTSATSTVAGTEKPVFAESGTIAGEKVSKESLVAHWKLDETSGNRADSHGSNTLTDNNSTGYTTGKLGNASSHDRASAQYLSAADNPDLSLGADTPFTWAMWVRPGDLANWRHLIGKGGSASTAALEYHFETQADGGWQFYMGDGGTSNVLQGLAGDFQVGKWTLVIFWHDPVADVMGGQIDQKTPRTDPWANGSQDTGGTFGLGRSPAWSITYDYDGDFDSVSFWKRVLTAAERAALFNSGVGLDYDDWTGASFVTALELATVQESGTISATSTVTGTEQLIESTLLYEESGTSSAASTVTGSEVAIDAESGTTSAASTATGSEILTGSESGTTSASSTVAGSEISIDAESGTTSASSTITGTEDHWLAESATISATATVTGTETVILAESATISATSTEDGTEDLILGSLLYEESGTVSATATVTGSEVSIDIESGTVSAASALAGPEGFTLAESGTTSTSSTVSGTESFTLAESGTTSTSSTVAGSETLTAQESASISITSTEDATETLILGTELFEESGTVSATSTVTGSEISIDIESGTTSSASAIAGPETLTANESATISIASTEDGTETLILGTELFEESGTVTASATVTGSEIEISLESGTVSATASPSGAEVTTSTESGTTSAASTIAGTEERILPESGTTSSSSTVTATESFTLAESGAPSAASTVGVSEILTVIESGGVVVVVDITGTETWSSTGDVAANKITVAENLRTATSASHGRIIVSLERGRSVIST